MLVPKKDKKVMMCLDFRDLNKACLNDDFPLPHIDVLVDNTVGSDVMSFMDGVDTVFCPPSICVLDPEKSKNIILSP